MKINFARALLSLFTSRLSRCSLRFPKVRDYPLNNEYRISLPRVLTDYETASRARRSSPELSRELRRTASRWLVDIPACQGSHFFAFWSAFLLILGVIVLWWGSTFVFFGWFGWIGFAKKSQGRRPNAKNKNICICIFRQIDKRSPPIPPIHPFTCV